ncbi:MAG: hypothetical protein HFG48_01035, partial [Bacilli bacterium]|nr:hypothetical protein [Bacilli bacterium]
QDPKNLQKLSMSLDVEKIIILLPDNNPICLQPAFLSKIISMGIYNFTTNVDGINYLLSNPNSYRDVAHLHQIEVTAQPTPQVMQQASSSFSGGMVTASVGGSFILGIKNLTEHAGATTLTYMLKKTLINCGVSTVAIEVNKRDFIFFNDKEMISVNKDGLASELLKHRNVQAILVDLNDVEEVDICTDVIYLLESSMIKLNKLMVRNRNIFEKMKGRKVVISKCVLSSKDVAEFEYEARIKSFFVVPPLDERSDNTEVLKDMLIKLGLVV